MTVADLIRQRAAALGRPLDHLPPEELALRLAAMPLDVADTAEGALWWMVYGERPGQASRRGRYSAA